MKDEERERYWEVDLLFEVGASLDSRGAGADLLVLLNPFLATLALNCP